MVRPYAVNGLNQYTSAGPAAFAYDANGNLTSDGSTTFAYDAENRLTSASGAKTATLGSDPLGRLASTAGAAGAGATSYLYDGDELIAEYDAANNLLRRYVHGAGDDDPLVWYEGPAMGANRRYLQTDHQGSVVSVADAGGNSLNTLTYDPWGIPASSNVGRFQYTGQAILPELGMYHYKARIYSPTLGRFLQTDPIGYKDQVNLYAYVANDPVDGRDPSGLWTCMKPGDDCARLKAFVAAIASAREHAKNGSAIAGKLDKVLDKLGKFGEKGIALGGGNVPGLAQTQGAGAILLNFGKIAQYSAGVAALNPSMAASRVINVVGGGVVAHEVTHEVQRTEDGQPSSRADFRNFEYNAFRTERGVHIGNGMNSGLYNLGWPIANSVSAITQATAASTNSDCERAGCD